MSDNDALQRRCDEAEALCALATELFQIDDPDALLDRLVLGALSILRAERGFVVLRRRSALDFKVVRNWSRDELEQAKDLVSRTIVAELFQTREPLLIEDALTDPRFAKAASVHGLRIRSVLAAPLELDGEVAGALYLESRTTEQLFRTHQLDLFRRLLALTSRALQTCTRRLWLEQRNQLLESDFLSRYHFPGIVTSDPGLLAVLEMVTQAAPTELPVLVQGPSGCGKELIARAIHLNSPRSRRPFRTVNCGAIAPTLLESELFGHVRGAFTGAVADKPGLLRSADSGTVFLDEIGELGRDVQVKLLRALQFGEVQPVGAAQTEQVDVRFVSATNRDLALDVQEGRFREDLMYRLNAVTLEVPPLRARPDDILLLFHHFLGREAQKAARPVPEVTPLLERWLRRYEWPGNVRELENETKRLFALTPTGLPLTVDRLSSRIAATMPAAQPESDGAPNLVEQEKELIELHLRLSKGHRARAAQSLGISRDGLRRKMLRYGLS